LDIRGINIMPKLKELLNNPKVWIIIAALFGTNGMQAYLNLDTSPKVEKPTVIVNEVIHKCICKCKLKEHLKEHHGGK